MTAPLPLLVEPEQLVPHLEDPSVLLVDLCKPESFAEGHIPGAVPMDPKSLVGGVSPAAGLFPGTDQIQTALRAIGLQADQHVVAYDDEGGGWACRLLWTLDVVGHPSGSLLNGGLRAWKAAGLPLTAEPTQVMPSDYSAELSGRALATRDEILGRLEDPDLALLDARTPAEYDGSKVRANKAGHIPGAVNLNWVDTMDKDRDLRFLPRERLLGMLRERGITSDKEVIAYCHTHHRSSHAYFMLKQLGFENIKGYAGSWSEWGNDPDTPVEL